MRNAINKLFSTEKAPPLLFLLMIYLIGVSTGNLGDALQSWLKPWQIAALGTISVVIIILLLDPIPKFITYLIKGRGTLSSEMGTLPKRHRGLIVLCSIGENISAEQAIRYHYRGLKNEHQDSILKHCWMITGGDASEQAARNLIVKLVSEGFPNNLFKIIQISGDDADNPTKVYKIIEDIFKSLPEGFKESDIISDYTGGTKSMTSGLVLACAIPSRELQFMKPRKYKDDGTADRAAGSDPRAVDIRFKLKEVGK
ncbi:MAG: hypothetical protein AB1480_12065 [Nitrospirota bacterium]